MAADSEDSAAAAICIGLRRDNPQRLSLSLMSDEESQPLTSPLISCRKEADDKQEEEEKVRAPVH